jgi:hypothetical protein
MTLKASTVPTRPWETLWDAVRSMKDKRIHFHNPFKLKGPPALKHEGGNDYAFKEGVDSVWINVNGVMVYIRRTDRTVACELIMVTGDGEYSVIREFGIDTGGLS